MSSYSNRPSSALPSAPGTGTPGHRLAIVIVAYNSADALPGLFESLPLGGPSQDLPLVVVVDNASSDNSVAVAKSYGPQVNIISMGRNAGYSAAINAAAALVGPNSHLLILNPDTRMHAGAIDTMLACLQDPNVGVVAPKILNEDGSLAYSVRREPSMQTAWSEALLGGPLASWFGFGEMVKSPSIYKFGGTFDWATGAALLISAQARQKVGDWDEAFFLYSEEVDYLRRVREAGLVAIYCPYAVSTHIGGESNSNPLLYALLTANRIRYFQRNNGPIAAKLFHAGVALGEAIRVWRGATHRAGLHAAVMLPPVSLKS